MSRHNRTRAWFINKFGLPFIILQLTLTIAFSLMGLVWQSIAFLLMFVGAFLNCLVFFANGKKMPSRGPIKDDEAVLYCSLTGKIRFPFLADRPELNDASIGDLLIAAGFLMFWLIQLRQLFNH